MEAVKRKSADQLVTNRKDVNRSGAPDPQQRAYDWWGNELGGTRWGKPIKKKSKAPKPSYSSNTNWNLATSIFQKKTHEQHCGIMDAWMSEWLESIKLLEISSMKPWPNVSENSTINEKYGENSSLRTTHNRFWEWNLNLIDMAFGASQEPDVTTKTLRRCSKISKVSQQRKTTPKASEKFPRDWFKWLTGKSAKWKFLCWIRSMVG